jgi:RNA polymerase sigma-70 factor (ECF subfamily)
LETTATYSEEELAIKLKNTDPGAFAYLYDHYSGALYGFILEIVTNTEQASEALQQVFVSAWKNIHTYDPTRDRLFTWLLQMARKTSIEMARLQRAENNGVPPSDRVNSISKSIHNLLEQLSPEDHAVFELAYFKGYTAEEIAVLKTISTVTVKTRIRNALIQIREYLK